MRTYIKSVNLVVWFEEGMAHWDNITQENANNILNDMQKCEEYKDHFIENNYSMEV